LTEIWTVQFSSAVTVSSVQFGRNGSEEPVTGPVATTATVKNQKTIHWFLCYKFVNLIIVAKPTDGPIKQSVKPASTSYCCVPQATRDNIQGVPGGMCHTSGGYSLC
jgi:hypothetical protein